MGTVVGSVVITKDIQLDDSLLPLIESITGRQGQDAIEHFTIACLENFLEAQPVLDALFQAKKDQQGH